MRRVLCSFLLVAGAGFAQPKSPAAQTSADFNGKKITIKYSAPSLRGRDVFGPNGPIRHDSTYPVWRAGANSATALHSDADLDINGLNVPKGDYTLFVVPDEGKWELIVNKQTGQWGLAYNKEMDLGRVPMNMSKPSAPIETFKISLTKTGPEKGDLTMEWAEYVATVPFTVK